MFDRGDEKSCLTLIFKGFSKSTHLWYTIFPMCTNREFDRKGSARHIRRLAAFFIAAVLLLLGTVPVHGASGAYLNYLFKDIYVDGYHINNFQLEDPVCIYKGSAYIPLDGLFSSLLGLEHLTGGGAVQLKKTDAVHYSAPSDLRFNDNHFEDRTGVPIYSGTEFYLVEEFLDPSAVTEAAREAQRLVRYGQQLAGIFQSKDPAGDNMSVTADAPAVQEDEPVRLDLKASDFFDCGGTLYVRLTALTSLEQLPYTAYFDSIGGLSISTDASVSAQYLFSNDNRSYIEGRAAYMRNAQPALTENDSIILEYLFRHEATVHGLDQDFLMALCRTESTYDLSLLERKSPIGLMQLMPRTVTGSGWTIEEVRDKHGNIQFGASYIAALIEMYNGNETKALAAYNQGSGKVASGNYSTGYSAKVQSYRTSLINWCSSHGYSNTFHEVSERLTGK